MQRAVTLIHHKQRRQFIVSTKTKPQGLKALAKRAFNLPSDIRSLRQADTRWSLEEVVARGQGEYEVQLEESEEEGRSEACSQKNMSKVSGRKNPPSENQLLESKFYVDDFQLFMSEVSARQNHRFFGMVFFNSRKKASFLGKKILRELIFEFHQVQFFYALHPIKVHTTSALLGQVLVFSLFQGRNMIHEREFPEQITAADEIVQYLKNLVKIGAIDFQAPPQPRKPKNLIHVHEQRSFEHKIDNSPEKLSDFGGKPNRTTELIKMKPVTPEKELRSRKIFTNPKPESPPKTNQISFQNDLFQPEWFWEGDTLSRIEKAFLSALIKASDPSLLSFLQGLNLKATSRQQMNVQLVKVFLRGAVEERLATLTVTQRQWVLDSQDNCKTFAYTALLKLQKFGNLADFLINITNGFEKEEKAKQGEEKREKERSNERSKDQNLKLWKTEEKVSDENIGGFGLNLIPQAVVFDVQEEHLVEDLPELNLEIRESQLQYSSIARNNTEKNKGGFTIKLLDCENEHENSYSESISPFRQSTKVRLEHIDIASLFHSQSLPELPPHVLKDIQFPFDYTPGDRAAIFDLILKHDAFTLENFVANPHRAKTLERLPPKIVKKYVSEIESRYGQIRQRTVVDGALGLKMQKLEIFHGLMYFLYKQRMINRKQLKIAFYLYTWSDLNILGAFELYLLDRNLDELVDTVYFIDYNYYQNNLYEIDHSEIVHFSKETQSQLIVLLLYEQHIRSGDDRISLQKFIRAGDTSLLNLYLNLSIPQDQLITQIQAMSKDKRQALLQLAKGGTSQEAIQAEQRKDRCKFTEQLLATRFKQFQKKELIMECILKGQSAITAIFDRWDQHKQQTEFVEAFTNYLDSIEDTHMELVLSEMAQQAGIDPSLLKECRMDIVRGIYEAYLQTHDKVDTIDSLERAIRKTSRQNSPRSNQ